MSWSSHCPHCITWNQFENKLGFQIRHKDCEAQNTRSKRKSVLAHHVGKPWVWGDSDAGQKGTGDQAWVWLPDVIVKPKTLISPTDPCLRQPHLTFLPSLETII